MYFLIYSFKFKSCYQFNYIYTFNVKPTYSKMTLNTFIRITKTIPKEL